MTIYRVATKSRTNVNIYFLVVVVTHQCRDLHRQSAETRAQVLEKNTSSPRKSVRRAAGEIGVPRSTMQKILKAEKFHSYKLQILHKLSGSTRGRS